MHMSVLTELQQILPLSSATRKVTKCGAKLYHQRHALSSVYHSSIYLPCMQLRFLYSSVQIIIINEASQEEGIFLSASFLLHPFHTHLTHFMDHKRITQTKCPLQGLKIHFSRGYPSQLSSCLLCQLLGNIASNIRWMQRTPLSIMAEDI